MKISNYDTEIVEAIADLSDDVRLLYKKSDEIIDRLMSLKGESKDGDSLNRLPEQTLDLTKECVSVLCEIEDKIGATHQMYVLQSAKLFNVITHASEHWGRLWFVSVKEHQSNGTSEDETNEALTTFRKCYKEMSKLNYQGEFKTEYENMCKDMHVYKLGETPAITASVNQKTEEIKAICQEIEDIAKAIVKLGPSSYKTPKIQWTGGIGGLIYDKVQEKRIAKMAQAPLYKDYTYENLCRKHIFEFASRVVNLQLEIQKEIPSSNPIYYDNVRLIYSSLENLLIAWHNYCPDVADAAIGYDKDGEYVSEFSQLAGSVKSEILKMDLPTEMQSLKNPPPTKKNGCLGIFIFLLGLSGGLVYWLIG